MKNCLKHFTNLLLIMAILSLLTACFHEDDEHPHQAKIIPAVNPSFDSITSIKKSATADGAFDVDVTTSQYTFANETITFSEGVVGSSGAFFKIEGKATIEDTSGDYTVYTYLKSDDDSVAANELTTYAVAAIVAGNKNHDDVAITTFDMAVTHLTHQTGLSTMDITMAMTAAQRADIPNLAPALQHMLASVTGTSVDLTALAAIKPLNMDQVAWGALLYDNWMTSPSSAPTSTSATAAVHNHGKPQARAEMNHAASTSSAFGEDKQPAALKVMLSSGTETHLTHDSKEHKGFRRFARCKECHGWDQMGNMGSHANRNPDQITLTNPNTSSDTGQFTRRPASIEGTNLMATGATKTAAKITEATGNYYANVASHKMAATAAELATAWNASVDEAVDGVRKSDKHPDFSRKAAADASGTSNAYEGAVNDIVPTKHQVEALEAFLNYDGAKMHHVMAWDSANSKYTVSEHGHSDHGQEHYAMYCFRCHGAPNTTSGNPLSPYTNMMGFITKGSSTINPVRFSATAHVARWGKAGAVMTRDRIGYTSAHDVAGVMKYLEAYQTEVEAIKADSNTTAVLTAATAMGNKGMGTAATGETFYYNNCAGCHAASHDDLTMSMASATEGSGEDTTFACHVVTTTGTTTVESKGDPLADGTCGDNHVIPNLGHAMHHTKMKNDLSTISSVMGNAPKLTQQNINDLAAFFNSLAHEGM